MQDDSSKESRPRRRRRHKEGKTTTTRRNKRTTDDNLSSGSLLLNASGYERPHQELPWLEDEETSSKYWKPTSQLNAFLTSPLYTDDLFPLTDIRSRIFAEQVMKLPRNCRVTNNSSIDWTTLESVMCNEFELCDPELGRGTYGVVRRLRHIRSGEEFAVKSIPKGSVCGSGVTGQVETEALVQLQLNHQNILKCWACIEDKDYLHLVLECCSRGDLYALLRSRPQRCFNEDEAFFYFMQLLNGLSHLHQNGFAHRDLKLENLLVTSDYTLKIADFGWAAHILGYQHNFNFCGTLDYLAPEMIKGEGHDWRVDCWGVGVILYETVTGRPPFQSTGHYELTQKALHATFPRPPHIAPDLLDVVQSFLQPDLAKRMTFEECQMTPWVRRMWNRFILRALRSCYIPHWEEEAPYTGASSF